MAVDHSTIHGFENTLDEAKAAVVDAFKKWLAWAGL